MSDVKVCRVCDIADCHHIREANTGVTVSDDGKITVDIAQADAMWQGLDPLARAEFTNMIFEPVLKSATEAKGMIADLTAERDALRAEVERLREAGYAMLDAFCILEDSAQIAASEKMQSALASGDQADE